MASRAAEPHILLTLQRSWPKAEEKTLDFEFEVVSAQFNQQGHYALRLTVENPLLQGSSAGIQLRINSGEVIQSCTGTTDTIEQSDLNQIYSFQRRKFTFTLPRGFCKNDKNHDVRLRIEALHFPQKAERMKRSRQVGKAFFAIYPRTNQPRMKLSAGRDEDWYCYSSVMALLRVGSEQPEMHCGRLAFTASLHEHRPPTMPDSPPPLSPGTQEENQHATGTAPASSALDISVPSCLLQTPESAYHSLPTEGHARSSERQRADPALSSSPELSGDSADEHPSSSSSFSSLVPASGRPLSHSSFHLSSPSYSPDLASSPAQQVSKSSMGTEEPGHTPAAGWGHVASVGKEAITVTLHSARNLPATQEGRVPWPYVVVKTSREDEQEPEATRASSVPTHEPIWEEEVTVEIDAEDVGWAVLTLIVADKATKEALGTFQLPVRHLQPFQPHHCRLVLPRMQDPMGTVLHVSIIRKRSFIPRCNGLSYTALEVLLQGLSSPLAPHTGILVAVARVITNVQEYKLCMEKHPTSSPGINPTTIPFPDPPAAAFSTARAANYGCPQVALGRGSCCAKMSAQICASALTSWRRASICLTEPMSQPAGPPEQPTWDTSFLFQGQDAATIFSEDTALAIEYYPYKAIWDAPGTLVPVGYSVLPLTSRVFQELVAHSGGMRVDGLAVQGTDLKTTSGAIPTVELCLQLLQSERPAAFLTLSGSDTFPRLDPSTFERSEELGAAPSHPFHCQLQQDVSLPTAGAVASILPRKQPFPRGTGAPLNKHRSQDIIKDHQESMSVGEMRGVGSSRDIGGHSSVLEADPDSRGDQNQASVSSTLLEVNSCHLALKRMAGDLLSLRQHVSSLEVENRHLRRSLASQEELGHTLLTDVDLDVMTQEELQDRLTTLKRKLVASTAEMRRLKDRVQQLQNKLIQKNDREKDLVLLQRAHQQQQAALRRCLEKMTKMKGLEETVRQQEKVIEAMERMLQKLAGVRRRSEKLPGEALSGEVYMALLAENRRLREELARPLHSSPHIVLRPLALSSVFGSQEKLSLLAKLEEAQARGRVLEKQLEEAARKRGQEKQELGTRLLEQKHGFPHIATSKLPAISTASPRRPQPLHPLP